MLRQWETVFDIKFGDDSPVYQQIADFIENEISRGRLRPGLAMPGSRVLADHLGVHRSTVTQAYDMLIAKGWLSSVRKKGTFVASAPAATPAQPAVDVPETIFSFNDFSRAARSEPFPTGRWLVKFDEGSPDLALAPINEFWRAYRRNFIWVSEGKIPSYNGNADRGFVFQELTHMLRLQRGMNLDCPHIAYVRGMQMALYLITRTLVQPGDIIVMEQPGHVAIAQVFRNAGADVAFVGHEHDGINTGDLQAICCQKAIKAVYVMPQCHYPTTVKMSKVKQELLLGMAERFDFVIVAADQGHEFWFDSEPNVPLSASFDGRTIYIGSLSHIMPPFSFITYIAGPVQFMASLRALWHIIDDQGDVAFEHTIVQMLKDGTIPRYIRKSQSAYQEKREWMAFALEKYLGKVARFEKPPAGLAFWVTLDEYIDMQELQRLCREKKIFLPSSATYYADGKPRNGLRLGYGNLSVQQMETGVRAIAGVIRGLAANAAAPNDDGNALITSARNNLLNGVL